MMYMKYFKIFICVLLVVGLFFSVAEAKKKRGDSMNYTYSSSIPISSGSSMKNEGSDFLRIFNSSNTVYIYIPDLILRDENGQEVFLNGESLSNQSTPPMGAVTPGTVNLSTTNSGLNGLDTGSVAANTWYYVYIIYSSQINRFSCVASTNYRYPDFTLFPEYTFFKRVGSFRTNSSSNVINFKQAGRSARFLEERELLSSVTGDSSWHSYRITTELPIYTATKFIFLFGCNGGIFGLSPTSTGEGGHYVKFSSAASTEYYDWVTNGRQNYETMEILNPALFGSAYTDIYYYSNSNNSTLIAIGWEE